jgi:hypothetical protein
VTQGQTWGCAVNTSSAWLAQLIFAWFLDMLGNGMWCSCCCSVGWGWPLEVMLLVCNVLELMMKLTAFVNCRFHKRKQLQHLPLMLKNMQ